MPFTVSIIILHSLKELAVHSADVFIEYYNYLKSGPICIWCFSTRLPCYCFLFMYFLLAGVNYVPQQRTLFFLPGIPQLPFMVPILSNTAGTNLTFSMRILSSVASLREPFGINQVEAIGIIPPTAAGMCTYYVTTLCTQDALVVHDCGSF